MNSPCPRYEPELYWIQILLFEIAFKGLLAWRWTVAIRRWPSALDRSLFVLLLIFALVAWSRRFRAAAVPVLEC